MINQTSNKPGENPQSPNPLKKFISDGQDRSLVQPLYKKVQQILTGGEELLYIAVQQSITNLAPDCIALTNRRFIIYKTKLLGGGSFKDYIWRDLRDAELDEGMMRASVSMKTTSGRLLRIGDLPKVQARKVYVLAQEMEEKMREERRGREMEEKRAGAGGIVMQPPAPASQAPEPQADPVQKLKQLKEMLESHLITEEEYEAKKSEILSNM